MTKTRPQRLETQVAQLVQYMATTRHHGSASGIGAVALANALDMTPRQLRHVISAAREDGLPLCGTPRTGYYIARTPEELKDAGAWLEARALHSLRLLARMRQVSLPILMGQLRLPS